MLRGQSRQEWCRQSRLARRDYFNGPKNRGIPGEPNEDSTDMANINCTAVTPLHAIHRLTFISVKTATTQKIFYSVRNKHTGALVTESIFFLGLFRHSESN